MIETFSPKGRFRGPIMPVTILKRKDLSSGAKILYSYLAALSGDTDFCYPSQKYLASMLGNTVRTIQNQIMELVEAGLIKTHKSNNSGSLRYYMVAHESLVSPKEELIKSKDEIFDDLKSLGRGYEKVSRGYEKVSSVYNNINNIKYKYPPYPPSFEVEKKLSIKTFTKEWGEDSGIKNKETFRNFEEIWSSWPRKEGKERAWKNWKMLWYAGQLPTQEDLIDSIRIFLSSVREDRYIPYFCNWLFDKRWKDNKVEKKLDKHSSKKSEEYDLDKLIKFWRSRDLEFISNKKNALTV